MVAKEEIQLDPLVKELLADLDATKTSIAAFAKRMRIPSPRIYKWKDQGNSPKTEDAAKIKEWLSLNPKTRLLEKVPHETSSQKNDNKGKGANNEEDIFLNGPIKVTAQEYVDALKKDKEDLQEIVKVNLTALTQMLSSLVRHDQAYHETILRALARIEKLEQTEALVLEAGTLEAERFLEEQKKHNEKAGNFRK